MIRKSVLLALIGLAAPWLCQAGQKIENSGIPAGGASSGMPVRLVVLGEALTAFGTGNLAGLGFAFTLPPSTIGRAPDAPVLLLPADGAALNVSTPAFQWTGTDPDGDSLTFNLDISTSASFSPVLLSSVGITGIPQGEDIFAGSFIPPSLAEGLYFWRVSGYDGSLSGPVSTAAFIVDLSSPVITIVKPLDGSIIGGTPPLIVAEYSDALSGLSTGTFRMFVDGEPVTADIFASSGSFKAGPLEDGPHTVLVSIADRAGNVGTATALFQVDSSSPAVIIISPADGDSVPADAAPLFVSTYSNGIAGIDTSGIRLYFGPVNVTGEALITASSTTFTPVTLPLGQHVFTIVVPDNVGNTTTASSTFTAVDMSSPVIVNNMPPGSFADWFNAGVAIPQADIDFLDVGGSFLSRFEIKSSTDPEGVGLSPDFTLVLSSVDFGAAIDSFTADWSLPEGAFDLMQQGTNYISVRAFDQAGNFSVAISTFVILKDTIPPDIPAGILLGGGGSGIQGPQPVTAGDARDILWCGDPQVAAALCPATATDTISGLSSAPVSLFYSTSPGMDFVLIASGVANSGVFTWNIPIVNSTQTLLQIVYRDLAGNMATQNGAIFTIGQPDLDLITGGPDVAITVPPGGGPGATYRLRANVLNSGLVKAPAGEDVRFIGVFPPVSCPGGGCDFNESVNIAGGTITPGNRNRATMSNVNKPDQGTYVDAVAITADDDLSLAEVSESNNTVVISLTVDPNNKVLVGACVLNDLFSSVLISFSAIHGLKNGEVFTMLTGSNAIDLVQIHNSGFPEIMASGILPANGFSGVRLIINSVTGTRADTGDSVVFNVTNPTFDVALPFTVSSTALTSEIILLDLIKSIRQTGPDSFDFTPTLLSASVQQRSWEISVSTNFVGIGVGGYVDLPLTISNTGTIDDVYQLSVFVASETVQAGLPEFVSVPAGSSVTIALNLTAPPDIGADTRLSVLFQVGAATNFLASAKGFVSLPALKTVEGMLEIVRDLLPPRTTLATIGPEFEAPEGKYVAAGTSVALSAFDPVVYSTCSGVAFTEFRVDAATPTAPFQLYSRPFTLDGDGLRTIEFRSQDNAGNLEEIRTAFVYVDGSPPLTEALLAGTTGQNGWHVSPVIVTLISTDALSGVATVYYSLDGGEAMVYTSSFVVAAEGAHSLVFHAADNVGNVEPERTALFRIDVTTPEIVAVSSPAPNAVGWNSAPVTVVFSGTDAVSGIDYCSSSFTVTAEGRDIPVSGYCADYAGWTSTAALTLNIDMTPPRIVISSPAAGQVFIATRGKIDISFAVSDNLDAAPVFEAFLVQTEDRGSARGGRPAVIVVSSSQAIEPLDIDDGLWRLTVSATDFADNAAYLEGGVFEVIHDVLPPVSALAVTGYPRFEADGLTYITDAASMTLTSLDDLMEPLDGIGLGVYKQTLLVKSGAAAVKELAFINPSPAQGEVFGSTFAFAGLSLPDGLYHLDYFAADVLDNIETVKRSTIALDNTPPVTAHAVTGPRYASQGLVYMSAAGAVALSAADPVSGGVASGLRAVYAGVDHAPFAPYAAPLTLREGVRTVAYYSDDNVNNAESPRAAELRVDGTPPVTALSPSGNWYIPPSGPGAGRLYAPARLAYSLSAHDPRVEDVSSGLAVTEYRVLRLAHLGGEPVPPRPEDLSAPFVAFDYGAPDNSFSLAEGIRRVDYRSRDNVLNLELTASATIFVDATPPVSALEVPASSCCTRSDGLVVSSLSPLTLRAEDPVTEGVASGPALSYFLEDGVGVLTRDHVNGRTFHYYIPSSRPDGPVDLYGYSVDNTGNAESPFAARVVLDNTPPAAALLSPSVSVENPGLCRLVGGAELKVIGTVTDKGTYPGGAPFDHFQSYELEFGYGAEPAAFTLIASSSPGAGLEAAVLGVWDTAGLPEGIYTLRLTARDCAGNESSVTAQVILAPPKLLLGLGSRGSGKGEFNAPSYIAVDPSDGGFWVSDTNNDRLQKFTSTGAYVLEIASWGGGTGPGKGKNKGDRFNKPQGVAVDSSGNVWAADRNNDRALKFSSEGGFLLELKAGLNKPHGVALDARDNLYVADRNNDRVLKFSPEGELLLTIDTGAGGELNKPQGVLAVDRNGLLYVADRNNDRVLVYDSSGAFVRELGEGPGGGPGQFNKPDGIALNALAYAFVADTNNSRVQKFDPYGNLVLVFDRASNDLEPLNHPGGLALDAEGNLFVVDSNNARVKKYGADGELVVIASQDDGGGGGGEDGERAGRLVVKGSGGKVHHPRGITLDIPAGALAADTEITITAGRKAEGYGYKASGAGRGKKLAGVTEGVEFGPDGTVFAEPVTISIPYDPARVPAGVDESELAVCRFDPASGVWEELPSSVDSRLRIVSARTEHFSLYAVMAPAVEGAAFALGEVYVFPNPALRGASPTFHIECGFADSVNIKIYTTSGRFAHETTLTGQPRVVDDGQGAQYVYEYAWREHIPSGVYYYLIEAARAGQKLKKTGKFAVVR